MADLEAPVGVLNLYATPTDLKRRLGIADTSHDVVLWHLLHVASRVVDGYCNRNFYVSTESKRYDCKNRLSVYVDDLIEATEVVEDHDRDGVYERTRDLSDVILYPLDTDPESRHGVPFSVLRISWRRSGACFPLGRASVKVTGRWGYRSHVVSLDGYTDDGGKTVTKASRSIRVDDDRNMMAGQTISIDGEQMFIRSVSASVLTVERGINGTGAAEHVDGSLLKALQFPAEVVEATLLLAVDRWRRRDGVARSDDVASGASRSIYDPRNDVKQLLGPYRRLSI